MKINVEMDMREFEHFMLYRKNATIFQQKEKELRSELGEKLEKIANLVYDALVENGNDEVHFSIKDQKKAIALWQAASDVFY